MLVSNSLLHALLQPRDVFEAPTTVAADVLLLSVHLRSREHTFAIFTHLVDDDVRARYSDVMSLPPKNWNVGLERSRAVRSARARERGEEVSSALMHLACKHGPQTLAEYARILNEEYFTPSGRGSWSISLVHRYMQKGGWTPKSLRAVFFKDFSGYVIDYPAHLYAEWRSEISRAYALSPENGIWIAAIAQDLLPPQTVRSARFGIGDCIERSPLAKYRCRFGKHDGSGEFLIESCGAIDLEGFKYFRSSDERRQDCIDAQTRIFSGAQKITRTLTDGWLR